MLALHPHDPPSAGPHRFLARLGEDTRTRSYLGAAPGRPPVRVRVLRSGQATDPTTRSAFTHRVGSAFQMKRASGLGGPHVAAVVDADLGSPVPWVATERPFGPDLAGLVREHGPLPAASLHTLALATAQGLAALYSAQRAHGTLTPESILLTGDRALLGSVPRMLSVGSALAPMPASGRPGNLSPADERGQPGGLAVRVTSAQREAVWWSRARNDPRNTT